MEEKKKRKNGNDREREFKKNRYLKIITMSWPDWFGFPIFNSVDWEMRERQREMVAEGRRERGEM